MPSPNGDTAPNGWDKCLHSPDVCPVGTILVPPYDGNTYLGLSASDSAFHFNEAIGQTITPLAAQQDYFFTFYLTTPDFSLGGGPYERCKIYLSNSTCGYDTLIYTSPPASDTAWQQMVVQFKPTRAYHYLTIASVFNPPQYPFPQYATYVCLDLLSPIYPGIYNAVNAPNAVKASVYPNPTTGLLYCNVPFQKYLVWDVFGRVVHQGSSEIDISKLPSGTYTVMLYGQGGEVLLRQKVLKVGE